MSVFETICVLSAVIAALYIYFTRNSKEKSVEDFTPTFPNDKNKVKC